MFCYFQICIGSNYYTEGHFEATVTVNLTGLLVMVTQLNDATSG